MTLEDYIKLEVRARMERLGFDGTASGCQDFRFRATVHEGRVQIYVHPQNESGSTTPTLDVRGNTVQMAAGSSAPGWES